MNEAYAEFFKEPFPARVAYEVAALPAGALMGIDVIAGKTSKNQVIQTNTKMALLSRQLSCLRGPQFE